MKIKLKSYFKEKENITYIFTSIVIFLICYGLVFNKYIINHDSLARIQGYIGGLSSGRFMRPILNKYLSFATYNPMNNSMLLYIFLLLSSITILKLFNIKRLLNKIIITFAIFSFPSFGFFWMYGNDMWIYSFGFFFSILTVYFVVKNKIKDYLLATICLIISLGTYQAMLSVTTTIKRNKNII